jgi:hypothetical protein
MFTLAFILISRTPDNFQQNGYDGNNQQYVNDATRMITEKADRPGDHENYSNDVQQISHNDDLIFEFNFYRRLKQYKTLPAEIIWQFRQIYAD